ncbi:MAG: aromatic amino acid transport family protein [bacterium]|nr:aromatic amino acid transport family protein [bacterium]
MTKNYLLAVASLMGTIIGVGLFAIPYVIVKSGLVPLIFYFVALAALQYYLHLLFAEIILSSKGDHRLPGYMEKHNGKYGKYLTLIIAIFSEYGATLAYIIVGGLFLHQLLNPIFGGSLAFYASILFALEAFIVLCGIKIMAEAEFIMTAFLILIILLISYKGLGLAHLSNYSLISWPNVFLPYGPIFFAVSGMVVIPDICKLLAREKEKIKSAIAWGTFSAAGLMMLFVAVIVGVTGGQTTPDTLAGLSGFFSPALLRAALLFGLFAIITSMIATMESTREIFWWDFKINKHLAWALAGLAPFFLYLFGWRDITKVVSLTGAVSGGILGIAVIYLALRIKQKCERQSCIKNKINDLIGFGLSLLFLLGLMYEIWNVFK